MQDKINLFDYDRTLLEKFFADLGEPPFRARQVLQWMYHRNVVEIDRMTDLSLELRNRLDSLACFELPIVVQDMESSDGTRKWLTKLSDGNIVEMVLIPEENRRTLCVSSQAGCALKCVFCATGRQGFSRNLSVSEIIGQLWLAEQLLRDKNEESCKLTNVVMMGMGEPLLNYPAVVTALRIMLDDLAYGLSRRRVTLSTAGHVPGIDLLGKECPVSLAVSLHAPDDTLRTQLVPLNKKYPIRSLLDACKRYVQRDSRGIITFEYIMLKDINDSEKQAYQLRSLLTELPSKVNLIPYNNVPGTDFHAPTPNVIDRFREILNNGGIVTITRKTRGNDIDAACGQLAGRVHGRGSSLLSEPTYVGSLQ